MQHLNYYGQESKKQSAVYHSDTLVTLKQGQGHQTGCELVDQKRGKNNAKLKNLAWTVSVKESTMFLANQEASQLFPLKVYESQK